MTLRQTLGALFAIVVPPGVTLPHADRAFDPDGRLKDPKIRASIEKACAELLRFIAAFQERR
jgi:NAD(P)H-dependent FMN reductase